MGQSKVKIDKYFVTTFFLIMDLPFLVLVFIYNDPRNCEMFYT